MDVFKLTLLPAGDGDCLLLTWGDDGGLHHMIVDGGRASAYPRLHARLADMARRSEPLHLYVLTHIDADHIAGALTFLRAKDRPLAPADVWFNGHAQTRRVCRRSFRQGDEYSELLAGTGWPWNRHFRDGVAAVETAPDPIDVAGLRITMLSPTLERLARLGEEWDRWFTGAPGRPERRGTRRPGEQLTPIPEPLVLEPLAVDGPIDTETPNGSSIAFIAEWRGRRVLLGADAHPDVLASSLGPLAAAEGGRLHVDLLKAPHHGSAKNMSRQLIEALDCRSLAISSNGNIHGHPDPEAIARFVLHGAPGMKHLHFNYDTPRTSPWRSMDAGARYGFDARFPEEVDGVMEIDLLALDDGGDAGVSVDAHEQ
ncbi:hypothetical protein KV697_13850 [Sphingomonas sanguinis]|uniref:ComEC/Rec2 family competence protein n=1 Tax=Sphingomonas sanguinis TaxID=33051 RepID=UPI001C58D3A3|nr:MBL fold metallo-hydrolase [Sphingomonas sanguinis]QXT34859.1 hypothetical protein KV697_13850 [Sphingomonas sanguinis]